jgi:hypothetical protein
MIHKFVHTCHHMFVGTLDRFCWGAFFAGCKSENVSFAEIAFTKDRVRALVSMGVRGGNGNPHGCDVVLQKASGIWRITGIWFSWAAEPFCSRG